MAPNPTKSSTEEKEPGKKSHFTKLCQLQLQLLGLFPVATKHLNNTTLSFKHHPCLSGYNSLHKLSNQRSGQSGINNRKIYILWSHKIFVYKQTNLLYMQFHSFHFVAAFVNGIQWWKCNSMQIFIVHMNEWFHIMKLITITVLSEHCTEERRGEWKGTRMLQPPGNSQFLISKPIHGTGGRE